LNSAATTSLMIAVLSTPQFARAQTADVATSPPNIVVPNYEGIPAGPFGGLEGSAYAARANDPSAAWFNPAGLSLAKGAQITGSAGLYQLTGVSPEALPGSGSSVQNLPNLVGLTVQASRTLTLGMAILTPVSWTQTTNAQLLTKPNGNQERFGYSANAAFNRRVAAFSAGYDSGRQWRVGGGLTFMYTSLTAAQTISDRIAAPTELRTLLVSSNVSGSEVQMGVVGGVQIDPSPHVRIGAVMRTPGVSLHETGTATLDGTAHTGATSLGASFLDSSAPFHYRMPFEATGAIAFVGSRAELEVDVHGYSSVAPYALI